MRLAVLATAITWRPRPLPSLAPSMIPGKSRSWILATTTLTILSSLNDSWQVKELDLGPLVLDTAGDSGQGGEFVGGHLAVHTS